MIQSAKLKWSVKMMLSWFDTFWNTIIHLGKCSTTTIPLEKGTVASLRKEFSSTSDMMCRLWLILESGTNTNLRVTKRQPDTVVAIWTLSECQMGISFHSPLSRNWYPVGYWVIVNGILLDSTILARDDYLHNFYIRIGVSSFICE
jgi:hypothetical protein